MDRRFVIYAPHYNINSGGVQVLYELAKVLTQRGCRVSIWVQGRPILSRDYFDLINWSVLRFLSRWFHYVRKRSRLPHGLRHTQSIDAANDIVVYPERITNNPLGFKNVIRWILYPPEPRTRGEVFCPTDLFFVWADIYINEFVPSPSPKLSFPLLQISKYRCEGKSSRRGSLVLYRKGATRQCIHHPEDATEIDGKSHEELCELFNRYERLYSYDLYTAYLTYAALCGCVPIVIPLEGVSEEQWLPNIRDRYGLAYGEHRLNFARETRPLLISRVEQQQLETEQEVEQFLQKVSERFGGATRL